MSVKVLLLVALVPSIILHEVSHGAVALLFGDPTAKEQGRLTLNPIRHIDPFGTILLPVMLSLSGAGAFGYAKPVPVNPRRLRHPRNHGLVVSLVGPVVNITLAVVAALVLRFLRPDGTVSNVITHFDGFRLLDPPPVGDQLLFAFGFVNVILAAFNLIPIPPLDGSAVIERLMPKSWWPKYLQLRQYSMVLVLVLVLAVPGALNTVFEPALRLWSNLLG
ncbi:MAG TPA: site-2 protease family protein [Acidimicrobiales bacterium]|nr:site-2 protease family protein [Acidimicrobiales bacterium]